MVFFSVRSKLGKIIQVSNEYWKFIISFKHPVMNGKEKLVKNALIGPDEIRQSKKDKAVFLYYKKHDSYWVCTVCKHLNGDGFVITAYLTDRIKEGNRIWIK